MNKIICSECRNEFESDSEKSVMCAECERILKSDIKVLEVVKYLCFTAAVIALLMFIPILAAQETSPGYYRLPGGKGRPSSFSKNGLLVLQILIVLASAGFVIAGLWFGKKLSEKQAKETNPLSIK